MGDWFQTIVDQQVRRDDAGLLSQKILAWLVQKRIVQATPCDCVLGGLGYLPGPNHREAVQEHIYYDHFLKLKTNGLKMQIGRYVYWPGQGDNDMFCPKCGILSEYDDAWNSAIVEWYESKGAGMLHCKTCGHTDSVTRWRYDPPWGFGNLGFIFWNWPTLDADFVEELCAKLGHKTVFLAGKL